MLLARKNCRSGFINTLMRLIRFLFHTMGLINLDSIDLVTEDIDQIVYEVVNAKAASEELSCKRAPKPIKRSPKKVCQNRKLN